MSSVSKMTDEQYEELKKQREIIQKLNHVHSISLFSYLNNELKARYQMLDLDIEFSYIQWIDYDNCISDSEKAKLKIIEDKFGGVSRKAVRVKFKDEDDNLNEIGLVPIAENLCLLQESQGPNMFNWKTQTKALNYPDIAAWIYVRYKGRKRENNRR